MEKIYMFDELLKKNCFSTDKKEKHDAANQLEQLYGCQISAIEMDESVLFAHHARGCTIVAAKICENAVIYQNVTIGSNLRYNKRTETWENVGNPVIGKNVIVSDGAKILGPVIIGDGSVIGAGAIITKNIPENSVAYGVNQYKPKDPDYDLVFYKNMIEPEQIVAACNDLIVKYNESKGCN